MPALRRVEPVSSSGPASMAITWSGRAASPPSILSASSTACRPHAPAPSALAHRGQQAQRRTGLKQSSAVVAPTRFASASAPHTYGVRPDAAMPTTTSAPDTAPSSSGHAPLPLMSARPPAVESSAPSTAFSRAPCPPAISPCTRCGELPNVGGHLSAKIIAEVIGAMPPNSAQLSSGSWRLTRRRPSSRAGRKSPRHSTAAARPP